MYIYLDKQGVVKEIINDEALRQSASNVNEIYVYFDGLQENDIGSILATYGLPDGTITDEKQVATQTQESEIPYDAERDLKYFQYYKTYPFYHFAIADLALSQEGVVRLMLRLVQKDGEYIKVAGLICFDVEGELVKDDHGISVAQYNYLVKAWVNANSFLPLDGSKAMQGNLDMGAHNVILNGKTLKDNNGALNYNGKDLAKQSDIAGLQTQVDTINATQNVVDIVGTKAELNAYETKDLHANDKIEVLVDESQNDANTIYGWDGNAWSLVGSKAPYYSKAESDARYNELKAKSYDKDTTGYVTGHVPDRALVKGSLDSVNEKVGALQADNQTTKTTIVGLVSSDTQNKKDIATLKGNYSAVQSQTNTNSSDIALLKTNTIKTDTDASLKSLTLPSAKDLKTKDGSSFGDTIPTLEITQTDDGMVLTSSSLTIVKSRVGTHSPIGKATIDFGGQSMIVTFYENAKLSEGFDHPYICSPMFINLGIINIWSMVTINLDTGEIEVISLANYSGFVINNSSVILGDESFANYYGTMYVDTINGKPIISGVESKDIKLQPTLVSGTNIKTINGNSILGAGDMSVGEKPFYELNLSSITDDVTLTKEQGEAIYNNGNLLDIKIILGEQGTFYFINGKTKINANGETFFYNPISWQLFGDIIEGLVFNKNGDTYTISFIRFSTPNTIELGSNNEIKLVNAFESSYMKTINGQSLVQGGSTDDIKVQAPLYRHTITLHNTATPSYFVFTIYRTMQEEVTKDTLFNVMNGYVCDGTGVVQNILIDKITFKTTDKTTKVHQYASFGASGYVDTEATFKSVFGTDYTIKDVVQL